jgi:uracil-DNA glycosylase
MDLYTSVFSNLPKGWEELFISSEPELKQISDILEAEKSKGKRIVPNQENIFRIFYMSPPEKISVVIFGMDPYPQILPNGEPRAQGFSFSVLKTDEIPSSLNNIYKEIINNYPDSIKPTHGDISHWVDQGVFLLNVCLTCEAYKPDSHAKYKLWMPFMDRFLKFMSNINKNLIFVLWGGQAQKLEPSIEKMYKNILKAVHPSGLSANRGFFGCNHFKMINDLLTNMNRPTIQWLEQQKSVEELRIKVIARLANENELKVLGEYYSESFEQNKIKKFNLHEYVIYVISLTIYNQKYKDKETYEEFLNRVQKEMENVSNPNFYEILLAKF